MRTIHVQNVITSMNMNTTTRFEVGDFARISRDSQYYGDNTEVNPKDTNGKITRADYSVDVRWETGRTNIYSRNDLKLYKKGE